MRFAKFLNQDKLTIKSLLAKLLANENINVIHDAKSDNASFCVKSRTLIIPGWKNLDDDTCNLIIGHEVGHAIYTPADEFEKIYKDKIQKNSTYLLAVNIVEDSRIERRMKKKYPGINKNFREGYKKLVASSLFYIPEKDSFYKNGVLTKESFLDRLTLYTKLSNYIDIKIPFTDEELVMVYGTEETETFGHVITVCDEIEKYLGKNHSNKDGNNGDDDNKNSDENDKEDNDGDKGKKKTKKHKNNSKNDNVTAGQLSDHFNKMLGISNIKEFFDFDKVIKNTSTYDVNIVNSHEHITDYMTTLVDMCGIHSLHDKAYQSDINHMYSEFSIKSAKIVNHMVSRFYMQKSAKESSKIKTHKTGIIDTNKLHSYKFNNSIFKTNVITKTGKSHGMIMFLDMSGSMGRMFLDSIKQVISLATFCLKVGIPFEVYGFNDNGDIHRKTVLYNRLMLVNFLSSKMNKSEINVAIKNMLSYGLVIEKRGYVISSHSKYSKYALSGTPLDVTIVASKEIYWRFQQMHHTDITNMVFITDGCSDYVIRNGKEHCKLKNGPFVYNYDQENSTKSVVTLLSDETNCKVVSFYLTKNLTSYCRPFSSLKPEKQDECLNTFNSKGYCEIPGVFDKYFIVNPSLVDSNNFGNGSACDNIANCKTMLNAFIDLISKDE